MDIETKKDREISNAISYKVVCGLYDICMVTLFTDEQRDSVSLHWHMSMGLEDALTRLQETYAGLEGPDDVVALGPTFDIRDLRRYPAKRFWDDSFSYIDEKDVCIGLYTRYGSFGYRRMTKEIVSIPTPEPNTASFNLIPDGTLDHSVQVGRAGVTHNVSAALAGLISSTANVPVPVDKEELEEHLDKLLDSYPKI